MNILFEKYAFAPDGVDGGGGASSGPASAPVATPVSGGGTLDSGASSVDESSFDIPEGDDLDSVVIPSEPVAKSATVESPAPVASVVKAPAGAGPEVTSPVQSPAPTVTQQATPAASAAEVNLDNLGEMMEADREGLIDMWAQNMFALSQEETDALTTNPEQVLPRLLARTLYHAVSSIPAQIKQFVPGLISNHLETTSKHSSASNEFFTSWPGLKGQEASVFHAINAIRAANPAAKRSEVIAMAGRMACVMLGLDPAKVGKVAVPMSGGNGNGAPVAPPFRPAGAGGSTNGTGGGNVNDPNSWLDGLDLPNSDR